MTNGKVKGKGLGVSISHNYMFRFGIVNRISTSSKDEKIRIILISFFHRFPVTLSDKYVHVYLARGRLSLHWFCLSLECPDVPTQL